MDFKQAGFTLVELVIVIIILGILAAVVVPKFIDLSSDARTSATNHVAASLAAASALNYSARKVNSAKGVAISNCTGVASALQSGLPSGYTITAATIAVDATVTCTLTGPGSTTATFLATGIT
ncbi:MAG: prepilin-type N-terminal cleavage/methylation domain-containing protein [Gammaproteobacteria bacterium]|nr:prepilin-type N-terminal cleavage/methylation domain-containing protein [Gammaproteobacteria bacterium]